MTELIVFALGSAGIVAVSRTSLRHPRSHGFFRFFAFEAILGIIVLNARHWFGDPFTPRQLASWVLLLSSAALAAHGFRLLRVVGKPEGGVEHTTRLVRVGAYRYVRHPLYGSLLLLALGALLKRPSVATAALTLVTIGSLIATARAEERENLARFGAAYAAYMQATRMFVPFLL
ncbi:MAG: isoprenylcysteine carboxylmethyltransferase family protein [Candidatus Rokubacteria bacterium]|nr:isoprenylcysteine carboxylmethyltransferase family protein [Candidatus Rokubacteria bacterium]